MLIASGRLIAIDLCCAAPGLRNSNLTLESCLFRNLLTPHNNIHGTHKMKCNHIHVPTTEVQGTVHWSATVFCTIIWLSSSLLSSQYDFQVNCNYPQLEGHDQWNHFMASTPTGGFRLYMNRFIIQCPRKFLTFQAPMNKVLLTCNIIASIFLVVCHWL